MGRFFLTLVLGLGLCAAAAWYFELWQGGTASARTVTETPGKDEEQPVKVTLGAPLYKPVKQPSRLTAPEERTSPDGKPIVEGTRRPIIVSAQLTPMDKVELGAEVEGSLLFVGEEIPESVLAVTGIAPFLADPFRAIPVNLGTHYTYKVYRRLHEGMTVEPDQMVALLNPARSLLEVSLRNTGVKAAVAEQRAADALYNEAYKRMERNKILIRDKAIPFEEYSGSIMTAQKYYQESLVKEEGIKKAIAELSMAEFQRKQHEIRSKIRQPRGTIKQIYKNSGDTVKASEPIVQLFSSEMLLAEGLVAEADRARVRAAKRIIVEPTIEQSPTYILKAHSNEVTGVGVARGNLIVSGGKDSRVFLWSLDQLYPIYQWDTDSPVRSLACRDAWVAAGCADGSLYLWNIDKKEESRKIAAHRDAVTTVAFHPDGAFFASGGADNLIQMWSTAKVWDRKEQKPEYPFDAAHVVGQRHRGSITALHFTSQAKLVSASRDNSIRVWDLHVGGAKLDRKIEGRSGQVSHLGVSHDGNHMLFDKPGGRELQLLHAQGGRIFCNLENPQGSTAFEVLAMFSPDSNLLLTAGAPEGRLQLWRTPTSTTRGFEVRQYVPKEGSPVTCAAFAPHSEFIVSGCMDHHVYVWPVPKPVEVQRHRIHLTKPPQLAGALDANPRQTRMAVEVYNPPVYKLTDRAVEELGKTSVGETAIKALAPLYNLEFLDKDAFIEALFRVLPREMPPQLRDTIVQHAEASPRLVPGRPVTVVVYD